MTATNRVFPPRETIEKLVDAAARAPSADNNQPWEFSYDEAAGRLLVYHDRARILPSDRLDKYNLLCIGMAIEGLRLAASSLGLLAGVRYVSDASDSALVAEIEFRSGAEPEQDASVLFSRHTDRRLYTRKPLPPAFHADIERLLNQPGAHLGFVESRRGIRTLARVVWSLDAVRFSKPSFHGELFSSLRYTLRDYRKRRDGLYAGHLLPPPFAGISLKCLSYWPLVNAIRVMGLTKMLLVSSWLQVLGSRRIYLLSVDRAEPRAFLEAGALFYRIWLAASQHGVSLHPLGSYPVFYDLAEDESSELNAGARRIVDRARHAIATFIPGAAERHPVAMFRVGMAKTPARGVLSVRRPTEDVLRFVVAPERYRENDKSSQPQLA